MVVGFIALLATVGVYGMVALLVRMDDFGLYLVDRSGNAPAGSADLMRTIGDILVVSLPGTIRLLGIIGTIAMLLVGGGMYVHNIQVIHHALTPLPTLLGDLLTGLVVGFIILGLHHLTTKRKPATN
jgi:predicted DNA repair protein MutK